MDIGTGAAASSRAAKGKSAVADGVALDVEGSGLKVSISSEARELAKDGISFDAARVERLRRASCEGDLPCDARRIATRLVEEG